MKKLLLPALLLCLGQTATHAQVENRVVEVTDSTVCDSGMAYLHVRQSQLGVNYSLYDSQNNLISGPTAGSNTDISFVYQVGSTETYHVVGEAAHSTCVTYDGNNDYIAADSLGFAYQNGYTFEAWVKSQNPSTGYYNPLMNVGVPGISDIEIYVRPGDLMVLYDRGKPGLQEHRFPLPPNNVWTHIAIVYTGTTTMAYYNGVQQNVVSGTPNGSLTKTNGAPTEFGWARNITTTQPHQKFMDGSIDDIRVWNTARSQSEISTNMSSCLTGTEQGLVLYYDLNGVSGDASAIDRAGTNDGALTSMDINLAWKIADANTLPCVNPVTATMNDEPTVSVITLDNSVTLSGMTLTANQTNATYQWIDCGTMQPILGTHGVSYTPSVSGSYAVIVVQQDCADTSACTFVSVVGNAEPKHNVRIYPNPSAGAFAIEGEQVEIVNVVNALGASVAHQLKNNGNTTTVELNAPAGLYFLQFTQEDKHYAERILIK